MVGQAHHCFRNLTMADERPSIEEILAQARAQDGGSGSPSEASPPAEAPAAPAEPAEAEKPAAKAKPPAAKPSGVSDILAMARSQDAGGDAVEETAAPEKPTADDDTPAVESPAADSDGDRPSVQEMLELLRHTDGQGGVPEAPYEINTVVDYQKVARQNCL